MAKCSLYELSFFLNCRFRRFYYPLIKKSRAEFSNAAFCYLFDYFLNRCGDSLLRWQGNTWELSSCASATCDRGPRNLMRTGVLAILKRKERELRLAKQQADAADQAKSAFITNISHDLRTPLTGLLGMAAILEKEVSTAKGKAAAANLIQAGQCLLDLLNEVIEFSKYEKGELPIDEVQFNLQERIDHIMALYIPAAQEKKLTIHLQWDEQLPLYLMGDAARLQRILLNLISNAIKFTSQGSITLRLRLVKIKRPQAMIEFQVQDTGIGIPTDKQALIFTRFNRLHPTYEGRYSGSGLGLALVKQFISELQGKIFLKSQENVGSIFTFLIPFRLPLVADKISNKPLRNSSTVTSIQINSVNKGILVVEDNRFAQIALKHLLESLGAIVNIANDGEEAIQKIKLEKYQLIFMDIGLPGKDGCEVTQEIRQWEKQNHLKPVWIVALSAHLDKKLEKCCLKSGMNQALTKPLQTEKLKQLLSEYKTKSIPTGRVGESVAGI